ncbi:hypothetical protein VPH35_137165 [Triticum aestivum]
MPPSFSRRHLEPSSESMSPKYHGMRLQPWSKWTEEIRNPQAVARVWLVTYLPLTFLHAQYSGEEERLAPLYKHGPAGSGQPGCRSTSLPATPTLAPHNTLGCLPWPPATR